MLLQAIFIAAHHSPVQVHNLGLWAFLSCLVTLPATILQALQVGHERTSLILRIINVCASLVLLVACISIPRRPHVFHKGRQVDPEWTVSAVNRYTWSWAGALLKAARKKGDLDAKDIPRPDHFIRAENLVSAWSEANHHGSLLRSLLRAYGHRLALQWLIILGRCTLAIGPFWAMLRLVQMLEKRDSIALPSMELWILVIFMGACTLGDQASIRFHRSPTRLGVVATDPNRSG